MYMNVYAVYEMQLLRAQIFSKGLLAVSWWAPLEVNNGGLSGSIGTSEPRPAK